MYYDSVGGSKLYSSIPFLWIQNPVYVGPTHFLLIQVIHVMSSTKEIFPMGGLSDFTVANMDDIH